MSDNILFLGYVKEKENYIEVLRLARKQREMLNSGSITGVISILKDKREILRRIDQIEQTIEKEKSEYSNKDERPRDTAAIIEEVSNIVEEILAVERENEVLFSTNRYSSKKRENETPVSARFAIASYARGIAGGNI